MKKTKLMLGDNIESLKKLPDNSIDSVVTDPPYGLSFMNKKWDYDVPSVDFWKEVYRVLKPGGHILSFGGTRTYHRMVVNIEDAGFEIRDQIMWLYGSGFPKSHNIGKAVDKLEGNEREVVGEMKGAGSTGTTYISGQEHYDGLDKGVFKSSYIGTKGQSPYEGWGTALKPANEPICVARKPLSEKSVAENVLKWGTGGINVDGCRVGNETIMTNMKNTKGGLYNLGNEDRTNEVENTFNEGRFPANIILECICDEVIKGEKGDRKPRPKVNDHNENSVFGIGGVGVENYDYNDKGDTHTDPNCPCRLLDEQSGESKSRSKYPEPDISSMSMTYYDGKEYEKGVVKGLKKEQTKEGFTDKGGASRFFYQAKVSKAERNMGLDGFVEVEVRDFRHGSEVSKDNRYRIDKDGNKTSKIELMKSKNTHPTVKPINLMAYLCRLITPQGGVVLDPFMGSGSTGIASQLEGFRFVGMEMDPDYFKIAESRINSYEEYKKFLKKL